MGIKTSNLRFAATQLTPVCSTPRPVPAPPNDCRAPTIPRPACRSATRYRSQTSTPCFQRPRPRSHGQLDQREQRPADHQVHVGRVQAGPPAVLFSHRQLEILHDPRGLRHVGSGEPHAGGGVLHLDVARRHRAGHALASWSSIIILFPQYGVSQYESSLFVGTNAALPAGQYGCWGNSWSCSTTLLRPIPAATKQHRGMR